MSFVYGITDQLTGYPYSAGALAAAIPIVLAPRLPAAFMGLYATVPRFVVNGAAGYSLDPPLRSQGMWGRLQLLKLLLLGSCPSFLTIQSTLHGTFF